MDSRCRIGFPNHIIWKKYQHSVVNLHPLPFSLCRDDAMHGSLTWAILAPLQSIFLNHPLEHWATEVFLLQHSDHGFALSIQWFPIESVFLCVKAINGLGLWLWPNGLKNLIMFHFPFNLNINFTAHYPVRNHRTE